MTDQDHFERLWSSGNLVAAHRFARMRVSGTSPESLCWHERAAFVRQLQALEGRDPNVIAKPAQTSPTPKTATWMS